MPRLVFDIDGVLCNFVDGMLAMADELGGYEGQPCCWKDVDTYNFFPSSMWDRVRNDAYFWLRLRKMPCVLSQMVLKGIFPDMYLTSRPISTTVTKEWLDRNFFPVARVVTVARPEDKLHFLEKGDVFVDDLPSTVRAAQAAGVTALLFDAPFHRGEPSESLKDLQIIKCVSEVARFINN